MKKEYIRYGFILITVVLFGLFVYPTLYRYDKLDQQYPVKINRITGNTYVLNGLKWEKVSGEPAINKLEKFKQEIYAKLSEDREEVKNDVINEIKQDIINQVTIEVRKELESTKKAIEIYRQSKTDPSKSFTIGSSKDDVKKIMGVPSSISKTFEYETWFYGTSSVDFVSGKVTGWHDPDGKLNTK